MADQTLLDWYKLVRGNPSADHYQLAGVERFESDIELIRASLTQRAKFANTAVRKSKGDDVADQLIARLRAAGKCLCNDARRSEYDRALVPQPPEIPVEIPASGSQTPASKEEVGAAPSQMPQIVVAANSGGRSRSRSRTRNRDSSKGKAQGSDSRRPILVIAGVLLAALLGGGWAYFSGDGPAPTGSRDVPKPSRSDRAFCYLVLREDIPRQLGLSNTQKMQHALATQAMSGKLNYIIGGIPNADLLPVDTEKLMNRVDKRREKIDELGASLKRMLTTSQKAKFWVLHASLGLASIEMKKDGKQFSVHFTTEGIQPNGQRYKSLDTQAAWSHLRSYSDILELVQRSQATTQELERDTINSSLSWLMQPYLGKETPATRDALAEALWKFYDDRESMIDQKHIALGLARVGCGRQHIDDWMQATQTHNLRPEHVIGGLCHFDLQTAGQYIIDDARKDELHNASVKALLTAGQSAVEIVAEANLITDGRHYGRFAQLVEDQGLDASSLATRDEMMKDPVKGKEIEQKIAADRAKATVENYQRALDELAKLEDVYAPPRAAYSLTSNYESFAPLVEQHGSPAPLLVAYIESDPKAGDLGRAVQALSFYATNEHVSTLTEVMNHGEAFFQARAWAAAALAVLSPNDFQTVTQDGFMSHQEIAHFVEACIELDRASVKVLAPLLNTSSREQATQVTKIIAKLDQPESKEILTNAPAHPSWSDFDSRSYRATIEQRIKELTNP